MHRLHHRLHADPHFPATASLIPPPHNDSQWSFSDPALSVKFATQGCTFNCTVACACTGNVAHLQVRVNAARERPFQLPVGYHAQNAYAYADWRPRYAPHIPPPRRSIWSVAFSSETARKSISHPLVPRSRNWSACLRGSEFL